MRMGSVECCSEEVQELKCVGFNGRWSWMWCI